PVHGLRIATDCIEYIIRNHLNWAPISIISAQLQPAKANPVQEIAFSMAIAMAYIDATLERGLGIDTVAPYFHFVINVDMDFFEGICKLRAYRKIWAQLMKERYGARRPEALKIRMMTSPTTIALTLQQPLNNIGRLAIMATACALGGAGESMTTPLHDEAHALPAEEAIRVGAALQHIVAHETGVADTIDPLAGSYYVEALTKQIESAARAEIDKIAQMGGALRAIESGYFQRTLGREQYERNQDIETGRRKWVGVNHLVQPGEKRQIEIFHAANTMEEEQVARLRALRARRDNSAVAAALDAVRQAARAGSNLVPPCLAAVKVYATHGEVCDALRDVFGVHTPDSQLTGV
ncbi:MAG TPA: methylmalonyl-CoA mutase family protein, partial [Steroidobacteraceae bacterium]|nr:methylmalonyl-CoA mutase family protein [Steroidobacteraceae bacterium]